MNCGLCQGVSGSFLVWLAICWPVMIALKSSSPTFGGPCLACKGICAWASAWPELWDDTDREGVLLGVVGLLFVGLAFGPGFALGCVLGTKFKSPGAGLTNGL